MGLQAGERGGGDGSSTRGSVIERVGNKYAGGGLGGEGVDFFVSHLPCLGFEGVCCGLLF